MNNEIIELLMEVHECVDTFNENLASYLEGKSGYVDYDILKKTFAINERLAQFDWGIDSKKWILYEKVARLMAQERYEEIAILKKLIDELETNELLHTNI